MANTTALQESSQALFCAIADIMGASESSKKLIFGSTEALTPYPTYLEFKADNNKIKSLSSSTFLSPIFASSGASFTALTVTVID